MVNHADPTTAAVVERLASFVCARLQTELDDAVLHQAKRLLLNQLKASAEAALQPELQQWLQQASAAATAAQRTDSAHVWWTGARTTQAEATALNARSLRQLDFGDTHLPSLEAGWTWGAEGDRYSGQYTAGIVPALLALAESGGHGGRQLLEALVVGLEVGIACGMLGDGPSAQHARHGARPLSIGAVAACCTLLKLDQAATTAALMKACIAVLAAPERADEVLAGLGQHWHLHDIALHCRPLPAWALAPVDAVLALRTQTSDRAVRSLELALSTPAWQLARSGQDNIDGLRPELRHCLAAAWKLGRFSAEELDPACLADPDILALRSRIALVADPGCADIAACSLTVRFDDGSAQQTRIDAFLGAPGQALSDSQLSELFRNAADDLVLPRRSGEILHGLWGLDRAADVRPWLSLLRRPA